MSSFRSPKRIVRLFLLLIVCFGLLSWNSSLYLTIPSPSNLLTKQSPASFELPNTLELSPYATWSKEEWVQERYYGLNLRQTVPALSFLQRLQIYETQGHNTTALSQLLPPPASLSSMHSHTITVIVHAIDKQSLLAQLDAVLAQTMSLQHIWIICSSKLVSSASTYAAKHHSSSSASFKIINYDYTNITTKSYPAKSAGATPWFPLLSQIQTDYVWILEDGVKPNSEYLKVMHGLLQTDEYKDALLGTHATLLPSNLNNYRENGTSKKKALSQIHCLPAAFHFLPKLTQPVDMVHHVWFLRTSWLPSLLIDRRPDALASPLSYYISQSLLRHAAIPSIVIPPASMSSSANGAKNLVFLQQLRSAVSCANIVPAAYQESQPWQRILALQSNPTALDQRQRSLMTSSETEKVLFFVDGLEEARAFIPLICRFSSFSTASDSDFLKQGSLHVVVTGNHRGLSGSLLSTLLNDTLTACHEQIVIHDLDLYTLMTPTDTATHATFLLSHLIQALQPQVLFHVQQDTPMFRSIYTMVKTQHLSAIQLPLNDIQHALWIAALPMEALQSWNQIKIDLVVITDRRPHSLSRLLNSISHANYLGSQVDLTIHMEQSADRVTRMFVNSFQWEHGIKNIRHRIRKGGLMPAIIESWYPTSNDNYGVLLEDDIEVSPLFYTWAKYSILHYRYSGSNAEAYRWMYGISLYSPRNLELLPQGRVAFDPNSVLMPAQFPPRTPYASQVPCSWGAVYFPEHWREFHSYLTSRLQDLQSSQPRLDIFVPNSRSERWKKSWKKYFIEMVYLRAYVMLYPNFQDFESFSTNHLEFGTHIKHERAQGALNSFVVPLMQRDTLISQLPNHRLPSFKKLPMMDLWGQLMTHRQMDTIAADWHQQVSSCARRPPHERFDPQDMLCPLLANATHLRPVAVAASKSTKKKQTKTVLSKHMLEHIEYVTVYVDDQKVHDGQGQVDMNGWDDMPEPLDVSKMTTSASDHEHEDDEYKDLEQIWLSLPKTAHRHND